MSPICAYDSPARRRLITAVARRPCSVRPFSPGIASRAAANCRANSLRVNGVPFCCSKYGPTLFPGAHVVGQRRHDRTPHIALSFLRGERKRIAALEGVDIGRGEADNVGTAQAGVAIERKAAAHHAGELVRCRRQLFLAPRHVTLAGLRQVDAEREIDFRVTALARPLGKRRQAIDEVARRAEKFKMNRLRDERNVKALLNRGWRVLIVWECAIKGKAVRPNIADAVKKWLETRAQTDVIPSVHLIPRL